MLGRCFMACVTQLLTYLRRESHLILLPLASALQAAIARLRAATSALDVLTAASAGLGADTAPQTIAVTILHMNRALRKRAMMDFLGVPPCDELTSSH